MEGKCLTPYDRFGDNPAMPFCAIALAVLQAHASGASYETGLASRCGSELDWAASWEEAAERARGGRLVLAFLTPYSDFRPASVGPLMDPFALEWIDELCVPWRWTRGQSSPLDSYEYYGVGPYSFGSAALLIEADGTVVGDLLSPQTFPFRDFLLQHLPGRAEPLGEASGDSVERARLHLRRAEPEAALATLEGASTYDEVRLRATILRVLRRGDAALEELARAAELGGPESELDIVLDTSIVLMRTGRAEEARDRLRSLAADHPSHARAPEVLFWLGASEAVCSGTDAARDPWNELVARHRDSRWAWQASGLALGSAFLSGTPPSFRWPDEGVLRFLRIPTAQVSSLDERERAELDAIEYLLANQRTDGSWRSTPAEMGATLYRTDSLTAAVTAIGGKALLAHRTRQGVSDAIAQSLDFIIGWSERQADEPEHGLRLDYSDWGYAYSLRFLAAEVRRGTIEPDDVATAVEALIEALRKSQRENGGWTYRVYTESAGGERVPKNESASFMTAAVILSLLEIEDAGFDVGSDQIEAAVACLLRSCSAPRTYDYFFTREEGRQSAGEQGAAGRAPVCTLALFRSGQATLEELRASLDVFMKHRRSYANETGKSLMHAAADSQGSHYLLFDYAWIGEAVNELPVDDRARYRVPVLEQVLEARRSNGSFLDNPINGVHYGTGMALEAMRLLTMGE